MKKILIGMILTLSLLTACSPQPLQTIGTTKYYVQIYDDGEAYSESDDIRYEYREGRQYVRWRECKNVIYE